MPTITPFLWFEDQAEEAMQFYASVFKDSHIGAIRRFSDVVPGPKGKVLTGTITLCGQEFMLLNGGPNGQQSKFTEAISLFVQVDTQAEIDYYWQALTAGGGQSGQCGWLKDQYGLSWQIVPKLLDELMGDPDPKRAERVTKAMLTMDRLDIVALQAAYDREA